MDLGMSGGNIGGAVGSAFGPVGAPIGAAIGSTLGAATGGIIGLFKKKKTAAQLQREMNIANDPNYYDKQASQYGNFLGAQSNWGLPGAQMYYQSNPKAAESLARTYGNVPEDWKRFTPAGTSFDNQASNLAMNTYNELAGPKTEQMSGMFAPARGQGFGSGFGGMGGYNGGYGGQLPMNPNNYEGTVLRPQMPQRPYRLMPGG